MGWSVETLDATFGVVVRDVELRTLRGPDVDRLIELWIEHALLVLPDQHLAPAEQDAVARHFGDLEFTAGPITNVAQDGEVRSDRTDDQVKSVIGNEGWHHDSSYRPVLARGAVVTAELLPTEGGDTGFADMRAAWESFDLDEQARLRRLTAAHAQLHSRRRKDAVPTPRDDGTSGLYDVDVPPRRPLSKVHPDTGRENLLVGHHAHAVDGMGPTESVAFVDEVNERAVAAAPTHHHRWSVGDCLIWDNRRLMHRATAFDLAQPRRIWHTRMAGDPATETALNH